MSILIRDLETLASIKAFSDHSFLSQNNYQDSLYKSIKCFELSLKISVLNQLYQNQLNSLKSICLKRPKKLCLKSM